MSDYSYILIVFGLRRERFAYFSSFKFIVFNKPNPRYLEFYLKSVSYNWNPWVTLYFARKARFLHGPFFAQFSTFLGAKQGPSLIYLLLLSSKKNFGFLTWKTLNFGPQSNAALAMTPRTQRMAATKFIFMKNPRLIGLVKERSEIMLRENQGRIREKLRKSMMVTNTESNSFHLC